MSLDMGTHGGNGNGRRRIGELLLGEGILSEPALERALIAQKRAGGMKLGGVLVGSGLVSEEALLEALSRLHRCPAVGWMTLSQATPAAVALLTAVRASRLGAFPYSVEKRTLSVAFADPSNIAALDEVAAVTGHRVVAAVTSEVRLKQAHEKFYGQAIPWQLSNILHRIETPGADKSGPPAAPPVLPPPPRFSGPDPEAEEIADEAALPELLADAAPKAAFPTEPPLADDPFGDAYSLAEFLADALAFGVPTEAVRTLAAEVQEDVPLDLGDPLPEQEALESTQPSRRAGRRAAADSESFGPLGALG